MLSLDRTTHTLLSQHQAVQRSPLDDTTMIYGHELGNVRLRALRLCC